MLNIRVKFLGFICLVILFFALFSGFLPALSYAKGEEQLDTDQDGVPDYMDNCPYIYN